MSVNKYVTRFTQLSRYAPGDVDTYEKQDCFLNGLNDGLAYALEAHDFDKVLVLVNRRGAMKPKRKKERQH
jgi:hypothetical protein